MRTQPNDGGPAFPVCYQHENLETGEKEVTAAFHGMSLRDWFAGQIAAAGLVQACGIGDLDKGRRDNLFKNHAAVAYEVADALLKEREKGQS